MNSLDKKIFDHLDFLANPPSDCVSAGKDTVDGIYKKVTCAGGKKAVIGSLNRLLKAKLITKHKSGRTYFYAPVRPNILDKVIS